MAKTNEKKATTAITANGTDTIKSVVKELTAVKDIAPITAIEGMFNASLLAENTARLTRARLYYSIRESAQIRNLIKVKTVDDFVEAHDYGDSKATVSEMINVHRYFIDTDNEYIREFVRIGAPSYTEMVRIGYANTHKGTRTAEEREKDIVLFLQTYAPDHFCSWSKVSELRTMIEAFNKGISVEDKAKADKTKSEKGKADKTKGDTPAKSNDYTAIKSVADTTKSEANTLIKSAKATGDIVVNKGRGITTVSASSVGDFMNKLVAIAKARNCKPLDLVGDITMNIKDSE